MHHLRLSHDAKLTGIRTKLLTPQSPANVVKSLRQANDARRRGLRWKRSSPLSNARSNVLS